MQIIHTLTPQKITQLLEAGYKTYPLAVEMLSDSHTPITVLRILKGTSRHCYLLESVAGSERWGRYTFLGYDPKLEITCRDGAMKVGEESFETQDPAGAIRQVLADYKSPRVPGLPTFTGGLVGYFSYDYLHYAEPTLDFSSQAGEGFRDVDLMLFDKVIAFDHFKQKIILMANAALKDGEAGCQKAETELAAMRELILGGTPCTADPGQMTTPITPLFDEGEYCRMVATVKDHIREGDIFQVVLSNRLSAGYTGSLLNTYRVLRTTNPSPYMFYFSSEDIEVAGASPETLVKLEDGVLHTFPLAGTRPRGKDEAEDVQLERALLKDEKELAEHDMLVDLGRNDLGRVSRFGSVAVETYRQIERFSHVMHIGSTVRGELAPGKDALDAVAAVLPAGTLSGAPKLRAAQIIGELEGNRRGIYGGAIGYIDFTGNMDTCIAIRIAYKKDGVVYIRSGAGIVADSVPQREYQECIQKAAAVVDALKAAQEVE